MLDKIAHILTRKPLLVLIIALALLVPSLIGMAATRVNYDVLTYLPSELDSAAGEQVLENTFKSAATSMLVVEKMPAGYSDKLCREINEVDGVSSALWLSSLIGVQFPIEMIPEQLRDIFYSGDATMMIVQYENPGASDKTMRAIEDVRALCNKNCFLAGFSAVIKDTRDLVDEEMPLYILLAVLLALVAMSITIDSWLLPLALLASIGLAIVYNMGTNIFLGEISYITKAIAAVLQLGVTMDYSIFLYNRFNEEKAFHSDKRDAMAVAIKSAFLSLSGSSLTTVAGFVALCFMRLTLGRDIGIVMAKGVILGVATVILVLPAIVLVFDNAITKTKHKTLLPNFEKLNGFIVKHKIAFVILFALLFIPAVYSQANAPIYYKLDDSLPQDMASIVATNKLKDDFNMASTHFVIIDDGISNYKMKEMTGKIESVDGIQSVASYSKFIDNSIPDFFVPDAIKDICKKDGLQLMMINSSYAIASDKASAQLKELKQIVKSYDANALITGEAALTDDLVEVATVDFQVTNYISIAAIFIIVALIFRSITIPIALVSSIELAIFINQGIPYFTDTAIPFIAPTVIGCIQLGATVDYAILMTTRFREEIQKGKSSAEAIKTAATASDPAIITSALVLFCATLGVALIAKIEIISSICIMLARGAVISALISIFVLPSILATFEPVFAHTSIHWRTPKQKRVKKERGEKREKLSAGKTENKD